MTTDVTFAINAGRMNSGVLMLLENQRSITSCIMKCMNHIKCKMVNFHDGTGQCEFIGQTLGDIETVNHPDWENYRIPQEEEKVLLLFHFLNRQSIDLTKNE